jgi:hypothetical protein
MRGAETFSRVRRDTGWAPFLPRLIGGFVKVPEEERSWLRPLYKQRSVSDMNRKAREKVMKAERG